MKKIFRKNQLIITALALMIAVAGYVSFAGTNGKDEDIMTQADAQDGMDLAYEISDEDTLAEEDIFTDTEDNGTQTADAGLQASQDNPGEAVMASAESGAVSSAADMKFAREQMRSRNKETLQAIIDNVNIDEAQKQDAINQMIAMTDAAEKENAAELLLEAKGFTDVVVSITDGSADVVLDMGEVTDAKRAQIEDIVKRKTGIDAANIVITQIQKDGSQQSNTEQSGTEGEQSAAEGSTEQQAN